MKNILLGILASLLLFSVYVTVVSLVSGWNFMLDQFRDYWYFVVPLSIGFGIQFGLYRHLKEAMKKRQRASSEKILAVSGTTSTAAMISCCAHYLVNVLPMLGAIGVITVISQYQVQLFWVGLAFNLAGLIYMVSQVRKSSKTL